MGPRILIADDHIILREGLRSLLEKQLRCSVVGEASDGVEAYQLAVKLKPEIVIMDVSMSGLNGIEATRKIIKRDRKTKVIALSMHSDKRFVIEMLNAGATGYLLKDCAFEELASAIRAVRAGKTYISPGITSVVVKDYLSYLSSSPPGVLEVLSDKEREVLQLLAAGRSAKEIAYILQISSKTVDAHRRSVLEKLGIRSIAELTKFAIREGLTPLEK